MKQDPNQDPSRRALQNLVDALGEDIAAAPPEQLFAETAEDHGDPDTFVGAFDRVAVRAVRQSRWRRFTSRAHAVAAAILPPTSWKPVMAAAAAITVVVMAGDIFMHVQPDVVTRDLAGAPARSDLPPAPDARAASSSPPAGEPQAAGGPTMAPAVPAPATSAGDASGPKRVETVHISIGEAEHSPVPGEAPAQNRGRLVPAGPGIGDQAPDPAAPAPKPVRTVHVGGQNGEHGAAALATPSPTPDFAAAGGIPDDQKAAGSQAPASAAVAAASPPVAREFAERKSTDSPSFGWPLRGRVIAGFGSTLNGVPNNGIDLAVPPGTDIRAADDGVVMNAEAAASGNLVLLRHRNGFVTAYARTGPLLVKAGDKVRRGQVIAKSAQALDAGESQFHFEIRRSATPVDPAQYLPPG